MFEVFLDKKSLFDNSNGRKCIKVPAKERACRKGHGLVDGFRGLSLTKANLSLGRANSLWRTRNDGGSLGDDVKSNESDCDSQVSDDTCLWEIYKSDDLMSKESRRSPKGKDSITSKNNVEIKKSATKLPVDSARSIQTYTHAGKKTGRLSPMLIASPKLATNYLKGKESKEHDYAKNSSKEYSETSTLLNKHKQKSKTKLSVETAQAQLELKNKNTSISTAVNPSIGKLNTRPISHYFQTKKSKLLSSPKLKIHNLKSVSTSKAAQRKSVKPTKSLSPADESFKGISFKIDPSLENVDENSNINLIVDAKCSKRNLKRHSSSLESCQSEIPFSTPTTEKRPYKERFAFSEPRVKRKIDVEINQGISVSDVTVKRVRREIQLENRSPSQFKQCFFSPLPNFNDIEAGVVPLEALKKCKSCGTNHTPLWRDADDGTPLCNACGIRWKKYRLRCTRCWYIPMKEENLVPYCSSCGHYNSVKRCNIFRRYLSSVY